MQRRSQYLQSFDADARDSWAVAYTHVLLDLDHTLLDTDTSLEMAFVDAMHMADADPTNQYAIFDEINRVLWKQVETGALTPPQVHIERFVRLNDHLNLGADPKAMADAFALGMGSHGDLYDGARALLDALAEVTTMAMITNGLSDIQRNRIDRLDLARYFEVVTISAEVGTAKPGTKIFDLTFDALGSPDRAATIMVGDNQGADIAGGNAAGIDTCWYNPDGKPAAREHPATTEIQELGQLVSIVTGG